MGDEESETQTHSETLDTRLTQETMDKFTPNREENGLAESEAARELIRTELNRDRRSERDGALGLTAGAGCLIVNLYLFGHTDALLAATALYIGLMLLWSSGWID